MAISQRLSQAQQGAARDHASFVPEEKTSYWPQSASHEPNLKIGDVIDALSEEFPLTAPSKIRHYESMDLIQPHRTSSNHRLFSQADVERLRFILRTQRDAYLPLSQIKVMLSQLDHGDVPEGEHPGALRVVDEGEVKRPQPGARLKISEVSELTGVAVRDIEKLVENGICMTDPRGRLTSASVDIVRYAHMLMAQGYSMYHIRSLRLAAHSHAVTIANNYAVERAKKTTVDGERVLSQTSEDAALFVRLYRGLLAENIDVELR